ncbi:MAG: extensin family protein [Pseudomonadota bacterium]
MRKPGAKASTTTAAKSDPAPDQYSQDDIQLAQARCRRLLGKIKAVTLSEAPIKKGPCGDAAPVKLISLGSSPEVAVVPPAIVNCDMVVALHSWLKNDLQPLARKHLKSPIVKLENMSSYSCRNAYGRKNGRLSEHAKANALDIRGFVTAKGKRARLLNHWGPTGRDIKAYRVARKKEAEERKARLAAAKAKSDELASSKGSSGEADVARAGAVPPTPALRKTTLIDGFSSVTLGNSAGSAPALSLAPNKLGGPVPVPSKKTGTGAGSGATPVVKVAAPAEPKPAWTGRALFLKEAHKRACRLFGTTLGPEANNAHRNHFHVDLAPRKRSNYCE